MPIVWVSLSEMDALLASLPFKQYLPQKLSYEKQETFLKLFILTFAGILAFATRLFSVLRYESVIHEFDPYFNYRTTKFLADEGFYSFHNWFDDRAWYPLGRIIGGTIYPGLMVTSAALYHTLRWFHITIDIRNVCVFLAPLFSSFTVIVTYLLTKELKVKLSWLQPRSRTPSLSISVSEYKCRLGRRLSDLDRTRLYLSFSGRLVR